MRNRKSLKYLLAPALCAALVTAGTGMAALAQSPDPAEGPEIVTEDQIEDSAPEDGFELSGEVVDEDQNEDQKGLPSEEAESEEEASGEAEPSDGDGTGSEAAAGEAALSDQVSEDQDPDPADPANLEEAGTGSEQIETDSGEIESDEQGSEEVVSDEPESEGVVSDEQGPEEAESEAPENGGQGLEAPAAGDPAQVQLPVPAKLTYTGKAQELLVPAERENGTSAPVEGAAETMTDSSASAPEEDQKEAPAEGTLYYSLDGENYGTAVPTAVNAGEYTVSYQLRSSEGNVLKAGSMTVTIEKADVTFIAPVPNT